MGKEYNRLCDSDLALMNIIWKYEPVNSGKLVMLCKMNLGWQKSTTYTMIKKLINKGYISNDKATVTALIPKDKAQTDEAVSFVDKAFGGSVTDLLIAYNKGRALKAKDIEKLSAFLEDIKAKG